MKRLILILLLASCTQEVEVLEFFDAERYEFGVICELGCTQVPDEVLVFSNGQGVNLNGATGLKDGEYLNVINGNNTARISIESLERRMVEEYGDSCILEYGSLDVFIVKE